MKPIAYLCTPSALMPVARYAEQFEREFQVGKYYTMEVVTERSHEQHGLFMQCMKVAYLNLPHGLAERFSPDPQQGATEFRKFCLIMRGFCHRHIKVFDTEQDAKVAAAIPELVSDFAMTTVKGCTLTLLIAKTQKYKKNDPDGMDKADFKASMDACLEEAAFRIGLSVDQLIAEAKKQMVREKRPARQTGGVMEASP